MSVIEIIGLASGRTTLLEYSDSELNENLMDWLRKNKITIASSCDGKGVCKKCHIQNGWLSCELTLTGLIEKSPERKIFIGYL